MKFFGPTIFGPKKGKQRNCNHNHNYNFMGFDTSEINLEF